MILSCNFFLMRVNLLQSGLKGHFVFRSIISHYSMVYSLCEIRSIREHNNKAVLTNGQEE